MPFPYPEPTHGHSTQVEQVEGLGAQLPEARDQRAG